MSSGQKVSFSFLTALILFIGFVIFAKPRLFGINKDGLVTKIETNFYKQSKISEKQAQLDKLSDCCNSYILNILNKVQNDEDSFLNDESVKTFLYKEPDSNREKAVEITKKRIDKINWLQNELPGINFRVIDNNRSNANNTSSTRHDIYYSTFPNDESESNGNYKTFKNYGTIISEEDELLSDLIIVKGDRPQPQFLLDHKNNRYIVSFPFYRYDNIYDATLVCYFNISNFIEYLMENDALLLGQNFDLITGTDLDITDDASKYTGGFVTGIPHSTLHEKESVAEFYKPVFDNWKNNSDSKIGRIIEEDGYTWIIFNNKTNPYFNISSIYKSSDFELPHEIIVLIYIAAFITLLLISFLIFSIKRDYVTIIRSRIKKVQLEIIKEYLDNHEKVEWNAVALQIAARKDDLNEEIKKSLGIKNSKSRKAHKYSQLTDTLLEASWDEILTVIGGKAEKNSESLSGATIDEIRRVLEEVLQTTALNVNVAKFSKNQMSETIVNQNQSSFDIEDVEEVETIEEVEEVEEIEDLDESDSLEEISDIEEVESIEDLDDLDNLEESDEVPKEESKDIETVEEADTLDEIDVVESAEETSEVDIIEKDEVVQEISEDIDDIDTAEEASDIETEETEEDVIEIIEEEGTDLKSSHLEEIEELNEEIPEETPPIYIPKIIEFDTPAVISGFETFCSLKDFSFPSVDSIFAEELCIGSELNYSTEDISDKDFVFNTYSLEFTSLEDEDIVCEQEGTDLPSKLSENFSSVLLQDSENLITSEIQDEENLPEVYEVDSVQDVLEELRCEVSEKTDKAEKPSDGIEELPEVIVAPIANTIMKEKSNTGSTRTLFTMTTANSFCISQEIGELEDAADELSDISFNLEMKSEDLSPLFSSQEDEVEDVEEVTDVEPLKELDADMPEKNNCENINYDTIIENEGIFSISKNLPYNNVEIDQSFKDLVDSVLR